ncbi:MAG TPA: hypothetical protein VJT71_02950, partial [Pyrinomonadaceae bacterium]|nr:hypothetical protein [Pyrinomonadaceae bacterium]
MNKRLAIYSRIIAVALLVGLSPSAFAQGTKTKTTVSEQSVRKYMTALAGDEMRGRASASADEL